MVSSREDHSSNAINGAVCGETARVEVKSPLVPTWVRIRGVASRGGRVALDRQSPNPHSGRLTKLIRYYNGTMQILGEEVGLSFGLRACAPGALFSTYLSSHTGGVSD